MGAARKRSVADGAEGTEGGVMLDWLIGPSRVDPSMQHIADAMARLNSQAVTNYIRVHGCYPHPFLSQNALWRDYLHIPTLEELAAKSADLAQRIDAAKVKNGIA